MPETPPNVVDEDVMVREFLRAELGSPRFSERYRRVLDERGWDASRLFANDADATRQRRELLGAVRGYRRDTWLFQGFPDGVHWTREVCAEAQLDRLYYGRFPEWVALSGGSRRVRDGARAMTGRHAEPALAARVAQTLADLQRGLPAPALIALAVAADRWVLLEGHTRATALACMHVAPALPLILGRGADFSGWAYV